MNELETILGTSVGHVTDDGLFSIEAVRCIGCCGLAPVMMIGNEVFGKLTPEKVPEIIADFRNRG
jgi:NADH-quinone oxidoreductase subunit E